MTRRHIKALRTLDAFDRIQCETGGLEAGMTQKKLKQNILKKYLEMNMRTWDDNIKRGVKNWFCF